MPTFIIKFVTPRVSIRREQRLMQRIDSRPADVFRRRQVERLAKTVLQGSGRDADPCRNIGNRDALG